MFRCLFPRDGFPWPGRIWRAKRILYTVIDKDNLSFRIIWTKSYRFNATRISDSNSRYVSMNLSHLDEAGRPQMVLDIIGQQANDHHFVSPDRVLTHVKAFEKEYRERGNLYKLRRSIHEESSLKTQTPIPPEDEHMYER